MQFARRVLTVRLVSGVRIMSTQRVTFIAKSMLFVAAWLLLGNPAEAGDVYRASRHDNSASPKVTAPVARAAALPISITIAPASPQPAAEPFIVGIRGPDGTLRRFSVEGGESAIVIRQVVVRSGTSITIEWRAAK